MTVNVAAPVNITTGKSKGSIMEEVRPCQHVCCFYCGVTPSIQVTLNLQCCCANALGGCCRAGAEGCICCEYKYWWTCTGLTCWKCVCNCCCLFKAGAFPCQKEPNGT